jgi:hypothetical protein
MPVEPRGPFLARNRHHRGLIKSSASDPLDARTRFTGVAETGRGDGIPSSAALRYQLREKRGASLPGSIRTVNVSF